MKASIPYNYHLPPYLAGVARAIPDKWGEGGSCFGGNKRPKRSEGPAGPVSHVKVWHQNYTQPNFRQLAKTFVFGIKVKSWNTNVIKG